MGVVTVVGNPKPRSRTLQFADRVAQAISDTTGISRGLTFDLATVAPIIFDASSEELDAMVRAVQESTVLVVASPTFKATYTGLLKAFFDRFPSGGLAANLAVPLMSGGTPDHALAVEMSLRPLLVELGASVPTTSIYLVVGEIERLNEIVDAWSRRNASTLKLWSASAH